MQLRRCLWLLSLVVGSVGVARALQPCVKGVYAGQFHVCVHLEEGKLRCWGRNTNGQLASFPSSSANHLGDTELPSSAPPANVVGNVTRVFRGWSSMCVILAEGELLCWGANGAGQLGVGHTQAIGASSSVSLSNARVFVNGTVAHVGLGSGSLCVVTTGGELYCCGSNFAGQLGLGLTDSTPTSTLVRIDVGAQVVWVATGGGHACAILTSGDLRCWGQNANGQLGLGHTETIGDNELASAAPLVDVGGTVDTVHAGNLMTCAALVSREIRCWGLNTAGQLGLGHTNSIGDNELPITQPPVQIGTVGFTKLAVAERHSCVLHTDGTVRCWGENAAGQLGLGHNDNVGDNELPSDVPAIRLPNSAVDIDCHGAFTCAMLVGGGIHCWGMNSFGQLGLGHVNAIAAPPSVAASIFPLSDVFGPIAGRPEPWFRCYTTVMNLTSLSIQRLLNGSFANLPGIQRVLLHSNPIVAIEPGAFVGLDRVEELDLGGTPLTSLPAGTFHGLSALRSLSLARTTLTSIDRDAFEGLSSLEHLNVSDTPLEALPTRTFEHLRTLRSLDLSGSPLVTVDGRLGALPELETLDVSSMALGSLTDDTFRLFPSLVSLDASWNNISRISANAFRNLTHLRTLSLQGLRMTAIDASVVFPMALESVNLASAGIRDLRESSFPLVLTQLSEVRVDPFFCEPKFRRVVISRGFTSFHICALCPRGSFCPGVVETGEEIVSCPAGHFSDEVGAQNASTCEPCPAGAFNPNEAQSSSGCLFCPAGTNSSAVGQSSLASCKPCPSGSYGASVGHAFCTPCPKGTFRVGVGASSSSECTPCPIGTWSESEGAASEGICGACPAGTVTAKTGSSALSDCVSSAQACPPGAVFSIQTGQCSSCSPGTFAQAGLCRECPAGRFSSQLGMALCQACPQGRFSNVLGAQSASVCALCPSAMVPSEDGSFCRSCPVGQLPSASSGQCETPELSHGGEIIPGFQVVAFNLSRAGTDSLLRVSSMAPDTFILVWSSSSATNSTEASPPEPSESDTASSSDSSGASSSSVFHDDDWVLPLAILFGLGVGLLVLTVTPKALEAPLSKADLFDLSHPLDVGDPVRRVPDFLGASATSSFVVATIVAVTLLSVQWTEGNVSKIQTLVFRSQDPTVASYSVSTDLSARLFLVGSDFDALNVSIVERDFCLTREASVDVPAWSIASVPSSSPALSSTSGIASAPANRWSVTAAVADLIDAPARVAVVDLVCPSCCVTETSSLAIRIPWTNQRVSAAVRSRRADSTQPDSRTVFSVNSTRAHITGAVATVSLFPEVIVDSLDDSVDSGFGILSSVVATQEADVVEFAAAGRPTTTWTLSVLFSPSDVISITTIDLRTPASQLLASMFALASALFSGHRFITLTVRKCRVRVRRRLGSKRRPLESTPPTEQPFQHENPLKRVPGTPSSPPEGEENTELVRGE